MCKAETGIEMEQLCISCFNKKDEPKTSIASDNGVNNGSNIICTQCDEVEVEIEYTKEDLTCMDKERLKEICGKRGIDSGMKRETGCIKLILADIQEKKSKKK